MIGQWTHTSRGSILYEFDPDDLNHCIAVARARGEIKAAAGIPDSSYIQDQDGLPGGVATHLRGLRAEWAICRMLGINPPTDATLEGDKHQPDIVLPIAGFTLEVKYNHYDRPDGKFILNGTSMDLFQADIGVLCKRPQGRPKVDADNLIEIVGYVSRATFKKYAEIDNFKYGDRLCVAAEFLSPFTMFMDWYQARIDRQI